MQGDTYELQEWTCDACGKTETVTVHKYLNRARSTGPADATGMPKKWGHVHLSYDEFRGGRFDVCPDCLPEAQRRTEELMAFVGAAIVYPPELAKYKPPVGVQP
jgi:hypothetical protein